MPLLEVTQMPPRCLQMPAIATWMNRHRLATEQAKRVPRAVQRQQLRTGCNDLCAVSMYLFDEPAQAGNRARKARAAGSAETTAQNGMQ